MLNKPRKGIVRSMLAQGTLAALLGMTLGCGASSPAGPTPTPVTPAPVAPVPVTPSGVYTVTAGTNTVAPGGQLNVSWTASIKGGNDWIALFKKGDSNTAPVAGWVGWTDGATSGTFTLSAPSQAGQYEFRYLLDDGYGDAARSSLVTVGVGL
jgi:hypothetical protein